MLRPREAARYVGLIRPTIDRWRKAGKFPKALQLGAQAIGGRRSDLDVWLNDRPTV
ncbi:MAG: AlpA family phage regulatory protein [Acidimicrobiaceae bacterium]|nr:AlpA family phage regulatory protein [Acidimicrobiaceae bacterium]